MNLQVNTSLIKERNSNYQKELTFYVQNLKEDLKKKVKSIEDSISPISIEYMR